MITCEPVLDVLGYVDVRLYWLPLYGIPSCWWLRSRILSSLGAGVRLISVRHSQVTGLRNLGLGTSLICPVSLFFVILYYHCLLTVFHGLTVSLQYLTV